MRINTSFEFKNGITVDQYQDYAHDARSEFFYGLSQGFKNNAQIKATGNNGELLIANFDDVKSIKISFD
ncbi:hypothetical protein ACDI16_02295 [Oceanobacillus caeni]